jgi:two-component system OmpR family sensor kinase
MDPDDHEAQLRSDLIANVSHDLRMPLVAMRGYLELLESRAEQLSVDERQRYIGIALRQCEQLGRLVDELFELARLDVPTTTLACERFALAELASDVVQKFALAAEEQRIDLATVAAERLPLVDADLGLIERVLDNLIDNALRHTPAGGAVRIVLERGDDGVRVRVRDTGAGIAATDLPHVFDRHWRGGASARGAGGLGLAIAQRILALHGGRVEVESELARGTCFSFSLPAATMATAAR